jgi:hypothetical protein
MSDREKVVSLRNRGVAAAIPLPRDLPKVDAYVQWRVENQEEFARFVEPFLCRIKPIPGDQLLVQGAMTGMDIQVSPGDVLILKDGRLGVIRIPESAKYRESDDSDDFKKGEAGHIAGDHLLN